MKKRLRSGFTTGACASAAAKAAAFGLINQDYPKKVEIPFPDGSSKQFSIHRYQKSGDSVIASVIKDAGDDPDVTNGAEIFAEVSLADDFIKESESCIRLDNIFLCRGKGVGIVTKPGLAISPGEPAINPVPRKMIVNAVHTVSTTTRLTITISVADGEALAEKTLNHRLGIIGGLSILGTTGIVRPVSADAWTATIQASLDVAKEAGLTDVVLSTGRTSEKAAEDFLKLPEEAYAMMGDYLKFSLTEAAARNFATVHLSGMWAKIMKAALRIPQTHVRNGALEVESAANLLVDLGAQGKLLDKLHSSNTAREMLTHLDAAGRTDLINAVCTRAKEYCQDVTGGHVEVYLTDHKAKIIAHV